MLTSAIQQSDSVIHICMCVCVCVCVCVFHVLSVAQSCPTVCDPVDCSLPGFSVHGVFQARILEWVAISFSGDLPNPGIEPTSPALADGFLPLHHLESPHI